MCPWGRSGGAAGSVTTGNRRFREHPNVVLRHQKLLHFVGEGKWSDGSVLAKVRELVMPAIERRGPTSPAAPFVVTKPDLLLEVLVVALDAPAHFGDADQFPE